MAQLTIEKIMMGPEFVGHLPQQARWNDNSDKIYFEWDQDSVPGEESFQYSLQDLKLERMDIEEIKDVPPSSGIYSNDFKQKLYSKNGDLFLYENHQELQITNTLGREIPICFSTNGRNIIYELDDNIYSWSRDNGIIEQLTQFVKGNARKEEKLSPQNAWLKRDQLEYFEILEERKYKEEIRDSFSDLLKPDRPKEIFLGKKSIDDIRVSPDLQYIVYRLRENSEQKSTEVPDYVTQSGYTKDLNARPKVGGDQPKYQSFIYNRMLDTVYQIDIEKVPGIYDKPGFMKEYHHGPEAYVDTFENPRSVSILGPVYSPESNHAVVVLRSEDHKDRWIMSLDLKSGTLDLIDQQHDDAWIGGPGVGGWGMSLGNVGFIDDQQLWFQSETTGFSHLYIYDFNTGAKRALTSGQYEILDATLSRDKSKFFVYSNKENPFENHFYHLSVSTGKWIKITDKPGDYTVEISPDEKRLAILYSYSNQPTELFWMDNHQHADMHQITKSITEDFEGYPWRDPEIIHFKARDGVMVPARIYEPTAEKKNGAAIVFVHGAGYLHNVHKYWSSYFREYMFHNFLADQGYTVLDIDYRGSAGYGRDWRTAIYRYMGGKDLEDQVDGAKYLISSKGIDANRLGVYGGSYGGFITLMALCTAPGTFKCGAALRSVTDWAHYNHGYTSNILNTPVEDSIAYYRSSPIYHAEGLKGELLMLHGMVDRNVHFQDVVRMSQRFIELGKDHWELAVFPMEDHGFVEPSSWTDEYKRIYKLFEENLRE